MSEFLREWDRAIQRALRNGFAAGVWEGPPYEPRLVGRTMHPSFMAATPPKYDPTRDKKD